MLYLLNNIEVGAHVFTRMASHSLCVYVFGRMCVRVFI